MSFIIVCMVRMVLLQLGNYTTNRRRTIHQLDTQVVKLLVYCKPKSYHFSMLCIIFCVTTCVLHIIIISDCDNTIGAHTWFGLVGLYFSTSDLVWSVWSDLQIRNNLHSQAMAMRHCRSTYQRNYPANENAKYIIEQGKID